MKLFSIILILISSFLFNAHSLDAPSNLKALEEKINSLNLDLTCKNNEDCVALPVGYKPCGGPERYIIASKANEKFKELGTTIDKHFEADKEWKYKENLASTCDVTEKPTARCQIKKCNAVGPLELFNLIE